MLRYVLLGFCSIAFGVFMILKPDVVWKINADWTTQDGSELSDLYVLSVRIGGGFMIFAGVLGLLSIIFSRMERVCCRSVFLV
ncbi:hypothetical protein D3C77_336940 [compost metagenome]